jgi:hypothetical protein
LFLILSCRIVRRFFDAGFLDLLDQIFHSLQQTTQRDMPAIIAIRKPLSFSFTEYRFIRKSPSIKIAIGKTERETGDGSGVRPAEPISPVFVLIAVALSRPSLPQRPLLKSGGFGGTS